MKKLFLLIMLILGNCTLAENIKKEEEKEYITGEWQAEDIDTSYMATEERLDYFYSQELVDLGYLVEIYPGYIETGTLQRVPRQELRYTWEEARILAEREFTFQKEKENWVNYKISERPRLLLEEGSKDFYRYYEYFVIDEKEKIYGSVLIPTYNRTEKLETASVRRYRNNGTFYEYKNIKYLYPENTEERLDFFYEYEDLNQLQISQIFMELIDSDPLEVVEYNRLKINWKRAREFALDEFEFQKNKLGWSGYQVSEKPQLLLDDKIERFYRYYEFFVRSGKDIVGSILIPTLYIADSTQTAEVRTYSVYGDTQEFDKVEIIKPEFTEERLEYFYEREPISEQQLSRLYREKLPNGESNPKELRIHWRDARELAQAELELQQDTRGWQSAEISERPILVLDKDGGDFYRYYEYRISKDNKLVGAIRIPAYRRTENFATAEVHYYSDDEKSYTIHPTMWGEYLSYEFDLLLNVENDPQIFQILESIYLNILRESNITENDLINNCINTILKNNNLLPISVNIIKDEIVNRIDNILENNYSESVILQVRSIYLTPYKIVSVKKELEKTLFNQVSEKIYNNFSIEIREDALNKGLLVYEKGIKDIFTNTFINMAKNNTDISKEPIANYLYEVYWNDIETNINNDKNLFWVGNAAGAVAGGSISLGNHFSSGGNWNNVNWGSVGISAGIGAMAPASVAGTIAAGVAGAVTSSVTGSSVAGDIASTAVGMTSPAGVGQHIANAVATTAMTGYQSVTANQTPSAGINSSAESAANSGGGDGDGENPGEDGGDNTGGGSGGNNE